ncbi:hypothetical protein A3860_13765 [Niastella vici]|uniref:DUF4249 domain-containing protein n=1 Tax=Niastella vici TaxID=1703345 RepID=A0A1V9G7F2_9BACT|nr:DUF4249 family protein [Niastella vici]OQP66543.1 hypothetical protein A3860_13765 [Niastella vici]
MKKIRNTYLLLSLLVIACNKNNTASTTFNYDLIVEGGINTLNERQYIRLTKPAGLAELSVKPVNGAAVSVFDGSNDITFTEIGNSGVYTAILNNNNNYGEPYTLHINYQGKQYQATDVLTGVVPIDSSYIPLTIQQGSDFTITIPRHIFGVSFAQQWLIMSQGNSWDPSQFNAKYNYSYSHVFGTPNALNPLTQQKNILHAGLNDSLIIYKFSLSSAYSTYLYNVFQETDWKGLLSSTPANVHGNISGNANGYFYAIDVDTQTEAVKDINK